MSRVLIASSLNWWGTARMPLLLSEAGITVDVIAPPGALVLSSSRCATKTALSGGARAIASRLTQVADDYDLVLPCDDQLLHALVRCGDPRVEPLLPAPREHLEVLLDKTLFSARAEELGIPVARWHVAEDAAQVRDAVAALGAKVMIKARSGWAGRTVRAAAGPDAAVKVAGKLGYPVLVEEWLKGEIALLPCLYDRGRLVAALAGHKSMTVGRHGPSSVLDMWEVDEPLTDIALRAGSAFHVNGFVSFDLVRDRSTGRISVLELNPRQVPSLYLGKRFGADMAGLLADALAGKPPKEPALAHAAGRIVSFPQELQRLRRAHGKLPGTLRWVAERGALREVPWGDAGLLRHYLGQAR